ncbi:MAG: ribosome-associated translation inhibitor RaiA [Elusimicrobiaceae bacterium]|jgi:putative sigma-54 modulation protein|uniref:Ribosome hibernation promoting factor n=1 Tax=Candidatus Avelusimicrobium gallicola TaxID=2562704 RepID=A0A928HEW3_9BACT|nr:ribosome-associated translation inhibitor RaiA [Elusimicrobium sp.]MBQ9970950.1 ribosome-associated translation inhibitor RaiA [Elusimicrobiaceae bacterium]
MDIKITAKNIKLTPAIKEYINTRVSKVENFFDNIVSAQVLISVEKKINQKAEIILHTGAKTTISASAVESNLYKAIDAAAVKAEAQAKKIKNKAKARKVSKKSVKEADLSTFAEHIMIQQNDVKFSVIKQVEVSPMNPEDAAYEMERLGYSFWMFLDEDSKQINLIFKRLDGTYGLIKPIKKK